MLAGVWELLSELRMQVRGYESKPAYMQIQLADFPDTGNPDLKSFATQKVERLQKFYDRIVDVDVFLKSGNDPAGEATAEFRVNIPTTRLFCTEHANSFEEALDKASHAMERQLIKWKEKHSNH